MPSRSDDLERARLVLKQAPATEPVMKVTPEELRRYAAAGRSIKETATELGVSYSTVFIRAKREGIAFKRPPATNTKVSDPTGKEMLGLYRKGAGDCYGVTRERVRQILTKHHGIDARHGGAHLTSRRRTISQAARRDAKYLAKYDAPLLSIKNFSKWGAR